MSDDLDQEVPLPVENIDWAQEARQFTCGPLLSWVMTPLLVRMREVLGDAGYVELEEKEPLLSVEPDQNLCVAWHDQVWRHPDSRARFRASVHSVVGWDRLRITHFQVFLRLLGEEVLQDVDFLENKVLQEVVAVSDVKDLLTCFPVGPERLQAWHDAYNMSLNTMTEEHQAAVCRRLLAQLDLMASC